MIPLELKTQEAVESIALREISITDLKNAVNDRN